MQESGSNESDGVHARELLSISWLEASDRLARVILHEDLPSPWYQAVPRSTDAMQRLRAMLCTTK